MPTGTAYAEEAVKTKYDKLKYDQYDCQAFVELVLKNLGVRKADGSVYNWKGSNDMYRNACSWVGTVEECKRLYGSVPVGSLAFMWDLTGNEKARGYYDGLGNASHVGIVISADTVRDSTKIKNASGQVTRDGVGSRPLKQFQKIGLLKCIDYAGTSSNICIECDRAEINKVYTALSDLIKIVEGWLK